MIGPVLGVLFDGLAYGMLLFLLSVGLSVTLGMMNFVNLAHCSFAMLGGYVTVTLMNGFGWPFLATLPCAFLAAAAVSVGLERTLYRRLYRASDLDQVLLTIGLAFISVAGGGLHLRDRAAADPDAALPARRRDGPGGQLRRVPAVPGRRGPGDHARSSSPRSSTRGSARGCGRRSTTSAWRGASASTSTGVFAVTFALGSGLAGLGGALAIEIVGLDPSFAFTYLVYVLIVVAVGGLGSIGGSFAAASLIGVSDVAGKYYAPQLGAFLIYLVMVAVLMWRPAGLLGRR